MSVHATNDDLATWGGVIEAVIASLPEPRAIDRVAVVRETASTQDTARRMSGGRPGLLVVAGRQTAGRGRLGRAWADAPGHSLAMTFVLDASRYEGGHVALATGVGACLAAENLGAADVGLKWPNDVVQRSTGRKLAGVLVEGDDGLLYVGVGMNVTHDSGDWPAGLRDRAVSLAQLGARVARLDAARLLVTNLVATLALAPDELVRIWHGRDTLVGTHQTFHHDGAEYAGRVESIEPGSGIVVKTDAGQTVRLPAATTSIAPDA